MNYRLLLVILLGLLHVGCDIDSTPTSSTGINKTTADIAVGSDGLTIEQRNVRKRLETDNEIGSIKHLYVISAYSGQVIIYSTVNGKVTSGNKRLTPALLDSDGHATMRVEIGDDKYYTSEVIGDDGTYGESMNYLFWYDTKGNYHQHYVGGGQIVHISSHALPVTGIVINLSGND